MAWTAPRTAQTSEVWSSSDWNTYVRGNLLETMPGKATAALQYFCSTGLNAIAARAAGGIAGDTATTGWVATSQTTSSTSYTDLTTVGPSVASTTGKRALVFYSAAMSNNTNSTQVSISVAVSGSTTIAADDTWRAMADGVDASRTNRFGMFHLFTTLTEGPNTFTMKYKVGSGATTGTFSDRHLIVVPF
jgi:hypothetical protein